jgi:hypothetical protein
VRIGRIGWLAAAMAAVTVGVAGCGGGSGPSGPVGTSTDAARQTQPAPDTVPAPVINTPQPPVLNQSRTPIVCTVYESGYATQVIFASESYDVRAECKAWTRGRPSEGYLWGYQPARVAATPTESKQVCFLTDRAGIVAARVIEVTGLRQASAAEAAHASSACMSLTASGWVKAHSPATEPRRHVRKSKRG